MSELKLTPCPFCGGAVTIERTLGIYEKMYGQREWWGIKCRTALNLGGTCAVEIAPSASPEAAAERWNRRATQPASAPADGQSHPYHRDLAGLNKFIAIYCGGDSRLISCAEAAWYKCMERNHPANAAVGAPQGQAEPVAWSTPNDWGNEPLTTALASVVAAWRTDGREVTPLYLAAPAQPTQAVERDATRYRWLCEEFGVTKLPCALEAMLLSGYVADGKESIDAAIDSAISSMTKETKNV